MLGLDASTLVIFAIALQTAFATGILAASLRIRRRGGALARLAVAASVVHLLLSCASCLVAVALRIIAAVADAMWTGEGAVTRLQHEARTESDMLAILEPMLAIGLGGTLVALALLAAAVLTRPRDVGSPRTF
jgi:hypothetical protein